MFYSNGVDQPGYGGICADNSYSEEATVICNQMGYQYQDFAYKYLFEKGLLLLVVVVVYFLLGGGGGADIPRFEIDCER